MAGTKKQGFTLIELLVVIAIIGILSTIGLVALNGARAKARDTQRLHDIRQYALAMHMYADSATTYIPTDLTTCKWKDSNFPLGSCIDLQTFFGSGTYPKDPGEVHAIVNPERFTFFIAGARCNDLTRIGCRDIDGWDSTGTRYTVTIPYFFAFTGTLDQGFALGFYLEYGVSGYGKGLHLLQEDGHIASIGE